MYRDAIKLFHGMVVQDGSDVPLLDDVAARALPLLDSLAVDLLECALALAEKADYFVAVGTFFCIYGDQFADNA